MIRHFFLLTTFIIAEIGVRAQPVKVEVKQEANGQWQLYRGGQPYYIKGAGGNTHLDKIVEIGGNSFRTWSADDAETILDEAHKRGLTVMMGLWVGHERHGFDYDNQAAVASQLERVDYKIILKKLY